MVMLIRKMLRELRTNRGAFLSIFLMALLAMAMFCTFEGHVLSKNASRDIFHKKCNLSDLWIYGEGFSEQQLDEVRELDIIDSAQLRMSVTGTAPECDGVQVDIYLERENVVNTPYLIKGEPFNPEDTEGVWLANAFAELRGIHIGDDFTVEYNGITFTKEVKGLIESVEYEYRQADGDADVYLENIAFVYMSYDAFPIREYVNHLVSMEKITAEASAVSDEELAQMLPYTEIIAVTKDGKALKHEEEIADVLENQYAAIVDRKSVQGLARLDSELEQHQSFSYVFVVIFLGIAILVIATSMSRMVEKQRTQIGTMNALGMKKWKVVLHYISYSFFVSALGTTAGTLAGVLWGAPVLTDIFAQYYIVPVSESVFSPVYVIMGLVIVLLCVLASYLSCRKLLKVKPAEALRPAAPKQGKKCIFEKLPFWSRLGFNTQYNLRDISRAKLRAAMGIVGTAAGMLLMVYGIACNSLVDEMIDISFEKTTPAEYQMKLSEDAKISVIDDVAKKSDGELVMVGQVEIAKEKNAKSADKEKQTITVLEGKGYYNILDADNNVTKLKAGSVGISRKVADNMDIKVGDTIYWHIYNENEWHGATVGMIYQNAEVQGIAYLREDFEKTGVKFAPTLFLSNNDLSSYASQDYVTAVNSKEEMKNAYIKSMEVVNIMVYMMILFSFIMVVVVLYNSGSVSFNERVKEFATLKVMGLQSGRIRRILSVQNIWLSVIGIIIGAPFGKMSFNAMMNSNGDNFDYNLTIPISAYLISGILVLAFSMLVSFMFSKRIKKLDMVEILKGME